MRMKGFSRLYILWMVVFTVIPLALILIFSLTTGDSLDILKLQVSLENFTRFFNSKYIDVLWISMSFALKSTLISLLIGYPLAFIIAKEKPRRRNIMIFLLVIPMWMNFLLRTYAWLSLLGKNGFINNIIVRLGFEPLKLIYNDGAILMGMVYNFLPFMVLPIYSVLIKIDQSLIEAAKDLGANKREVFLKVILPLSMSGVLTGITMVFMPAVSTFVIPRLLGGGQYMLIGNLIEQQFLWVGDWNFGSAISIIMMVFIFLTMAVASKLDKNKEEI